jgi:5-methylcytosine-specific restriction endonuclease McrA
MTDRKEYYKEYRRKNRERVKNAQKAYQQSHRDTLGAYQKEYREKNHDRWRDAVLDRDMHRCSKCGSSDGLLHAHHLKEARSCIELRYDVSNGVTPCKECHEKIHRRKFW